jgi:hypothetical protein
MVSLQVLTRFQLIFPSKTWFFRIYLNFLRQKSLKNQHLPHFESKSYQINSIKSCSSRSFQERQMHIPIPSIVSVMIQYSRTFAPQVQTSWNQGHAPLIVEGFPKRPRTKFEASWFGGSHNYKTNYLPS